MVQSHGYKNQGGPQGSVAQNSRFLDLDLSNWNNWSYSPASSEKGDGLEKVIVPLFTEKENVFLLSCMRSL